MPPSLTGTRIPQAISQRISHAPVELSQAGRAASGVRAGRAVLGRRLCSAAVGAVEERRAPVGGLCGRELPGRAVANRLRSSVETYGLRAILAYFSWLSCALRRWCCRARERRRSRSDPTRSDASATLRMVYMVRMVHMVNMVQPLAPASAGPHHRELPRRACVRDALKDGLVLPPHAVRLQQPLLLPALEHGSVGFVQAAVDVRVRRGVHGDAEGGKMLGVFTRSCTQLRATCERPWLPRRKSRDTHTIAVRTKRAGLTPSLPRPIAWRYGSSRA